MNNPGGFGFSAFVRSLWVRTVPALLKRYASRSVATPFHGCAHCSTTRSVALPATVMPKVLSTGAPGLKSSHWVAKAGLFAGHAPPLRNAGDSHDAKSLPPERRLLLAASLK